MTLMEFNVTQNILVLIVISILICNSSPAESKAQKNKASKGEPAKAKQAERDLPPELIERMKQVIKGEASYTPEQFSILKKEGYLSDFCKPRYRESLKIGRLIAEGGFGMVYAGEYTKKDKKPVPVAVKFVTFGKHERQSVFQEIYFMQKFRSSNRLMHQLICFYETEAERHDRLKVLSRKRSLTKNELEEYKNPKNKAIIVMKMMNSDLRTHLGQRNLNNPAEALTTFINCAKAIRELHKTKVMHRDIKPENFLVDGDGNIYLSDYGTAIEAHSARARAGTFGFMAPELMAGSEYTNKVDIYSLGITFINLLTKKNPKHFVNNIETNPVINQNALPRNHFLNQLLIGMTSQDPKLRPNIDNVVEALGKFYQNISKSSKGAIVIV